MTTVLDSYDATGRLDEPERAAFPPAPSASQLGPMARPGTCAFAWRAGCGTASARFYLRGWRCELHADLDPEALNLLNER